MSRTEFSNERWLVAVGADHVTGSFLQVWPQPHEGYDRPRLVIDNMGARLQAPSEDTTELPLLPLSVLEELGRVRVRFQVAAQAGNTRPNIDAETIIRFAKLLGFEGIEAEVYGVLD